MRDAYGFSESFSAWRWFQSQYSGCSDDLISALFPQPMISAVPIHDVNNSSRYRHLLVHKTALPIHAPAGPVAGPYESIGLRRAADIPAQSKVFRGRHLFPVFRRLASVPLVPLVRSMLKKPGYLHVPLGAWGDGWVQSQCR
jgi:hypothetical protein